jgi:hypothetical protein
MGNERPWEGGRDLVLDARNAWVTEDRMLEWPATETAAPESVLTVVANEGGGGVPLVVDDGLVRIRWSGDTFEVGELPLVVECVAYPEWRRRAGLAAPSAGRGLGAECPAVDALVHLGVAFPRAV